jgi:hypothetical protein
MHGLRRYFKFGLNFLHEQNCLVALRRAGLYRLLLTPVQLELGLCGESVPKLADVFAEVNALVGGQHYGVDLHKQRRPFGCGSRKLRSFCN